MRQHNVKLSSFLALTISTHIMVAMLSACGTPTEIQEEPEQVVSTGETPSSSATEGRLSGTTDILQNDKNQAELVGQCKARELAMDNSVQEQQFAEDSIPETNSSSSEMLQTGQCLPFPDSAKLNLPTCLDACSRGGVVIENFCRSIPHPAVKAACWAARYAGTTACMGFCYWYF